MNTRRLWIVMVAFFGMCSGQVHAAEQVSGWVENAALLHGDLILPAKLDTGADHSSLCAESLTEFEKNGKPWVRFQVTGAGGESRWIEAEMLRSARIKSRCGERERRPVVKLGLCVGKVFRDVEINLVDRRQFEYPLLVGRSFLAPGIIVDPSRTHLTPPECGDQAKP